MYLMEDRPLNAQQVLLIIEKEVSHSHNPNVNNFRKNHKEFIKNKKIILKIQQRFRSKMS